MKPFKILNTNNNPYFRNKTRPMGPGNDKNYRAKLLNERKAEIDSILKNFDELSKNEIKRSKTIFQQHLDLLNGDENTIIEVPEVDIKVDDDYFEK